MDELFFTGMDIPKQTRILVEKATDNVCKGMTDSEKKAYLGGIENTLSALQHLLELDGEPVVHIPYHDGLEEVAIEELEEIFLK
jgi:hypothetical protein